MYRRHISTGASSLIMALAAIVAATPPTIASRHPMAPRPTYRRRHWSKPREAQAGRLIRGAFTGKRTTPDHEVPTKHLSSAARQRRDLAIAMKAA